MLNVPCIAKTDDWLNDCVKFYVQINTKIGHFRDVLPSQSLNTVLTKLKNDKSRHAPINQKTPLHKTNIKKLKPGLVLLCNIWPETDQDYSYSSRACMRRKMLGTGARLLKKSKQLFLVLRPNPFKTLIKIYMQLTSLVTLLRNRCKTQLHCW